MLHCLRNIYAIGLSSYAEILIKWKRLKKAGSITVNHSIIKITEVLLFLLQRGGESSMVFDIKISE